MRYLAIDCGNTRRKATLWEGDQEISHSPAEADMAIWCSVGPELDNQTKALASRWIILSAKTPLPITLKYSTPETLGADRIALACGVASKNDFLIVDAGSCVTYDVVRDGTFEGGNIGPGLQMQLQAMHDGTAHLPMTTFQPTDQAIGGSTVEAMRLGAVMNIAGAIEKYARMIPGCKVIMTGGDALSISPYLNIEHEVNSNLLMQGLLKIMKFNEKRF